MHYDRVGTLGRMRYKVPRSHRSKKELVKMFTSRLRQSWTRRKMMASDAHQNMPSMEDNCMENFDMATHWSVGSWERGERDMNAHV